MCYCLRESQRKDDIALIQLIHIILSYLGLLGLHILPYLNRIYHMHTP
jgi:hypothetical protein